MSHQLHRVEIVHSGAAEGAVAGRKARRFDQMGLERPDRPPAEGWCRCSGGYRARKGQSAWCGEAGRQGYARGRSGLARHLRRPRARPVIPLYKLWRWRRYRACAPPARVPINPDDCAAPSLPGDGAWFSAARASFAGRLGGPPPGRAPGQTERTETCDKHDFGGADPPRFSLRRDRDGRRRGRSARCSCR